MKKSWSYITLLAALAAGTAAAQSTPTPAGTVITNTADITFTPEGSTTPSTVTSDPVKTTVLPKPSFTVTPNDNGGAGNVTDPHYAAPGQTAPVVPCQKNVTFKYTASNTGNLNGESYTITNTAPTAADGVNAPENVRFALDANSNGTLDANELAAATPTLTISGVDIGKSKDFFQIYDIPCTATIKEGDKFGADPTGAYNDNPAYNEDPTSVPKDANNTNVSTVGPVKDAVKIGPKNDPLAGDTPATTPPYNSPEGIVVTPDNADQQVANLTATQSTITFTNTLQNTGERPDAFSVSQTSNLPAGSTVEFFKDVNNDGVYQPGTDTPLPAGGAVGTLNPGETANVFVKVTLPPNADVSGTPFTVTVTTAGTHGQTDTTKDIINVEKKPSLSFGDPTPTPGGDPTPVGTPPVSAPNDPNFPNGSGNPASPLVPPTNCTAPIRTYLPMDIANLGNVSDSYNVSGTAPVTVLNADGTVNPTPVVVPVVYYKDVNKDGKLDSGDTLLTDSAADADSIPDTGTLKPGEEIKLIAVVNVPCAAAKQTITLNQTATSPTTGQTVIDSNDTITVGGNPTVAKPTKNVDKPTAYPGETLTYTIVGKNTSNANITKAMVCDTLPANTSFVSWTATSDQAGAILYSTNGGTSWSATAPTTAGTKLCAAVDTNNDGNITVADILAPGKSINVTYKVKVN